jgi:hypothetical protein
MSGYGFATLGRECTQAAKASIPSTTVSKTNGMVQIERVPSAGQFGVHLYGNMFDLRSWSASDLGRGA